MAGQRSGQVRQKDMFPQKSCLQEKMPVFIQGVRREYGNCDGRQTECKSGAGTDTEVLTQVSEGETYEIRGEQADGWYPVKVGEINGWVYGAYVTTGFPILMGLGHRAYAPFKLMSRYRWC